MSDIFNEYAKIAIEKGLIVEAKETEVTNPRYDSVDLEAIALLYGIKPNGKDDDKHIVEQAHPDSVIVSPAYDRINGLVENGLERQDVMHYIATKPNHGKHINERYVKAKQELIDNVIKTAFTLDKNDETDLMALADSCAERLTKKAMVPTSLLAAGVVISKIPWMVRVGTAALTAIGLVNNFGGEIDKGVQQNADAARTSLESITDNFPKLSSKIYDLIDRIIKIQDLNNELTDAHIALSEDASSEAAYSKNEKRLIEYIKSTRELSTEIRRFVNMLNRLTDESWLIKHMGNFGAIIQEGINLISAPDGAQAVTALETLDESLNESIGNMRSTLREIKQASTEEDPEALNKLLKQHDLPEEASKEEVDPLDELGETLRGKSKEPVTQDIFSVPISDLSYRSEKE